jgi:hypothetical protein
MQALGRRSFVDRKTNGLAVVSLKLQDSSGRSSGAAASMTAKFRRLPERVPLKRSNVVPAETLQHHTAVPLSTAALSAR